MKDYKSLLKDLSADQKALFLEKILEKSPELQIQLRNFFAAPIEKAPVEIFNYSEKLAKYRSEYLSELEELNLEEPDYERDFNHRDRYYDHWEIDQMLIEEEVTDLFMGFADKIILVSQQGSLKEALCRLTALLEACILAEVDDPYDNLGGDANEAFVEYFATCLQNVQQQLSCIVFNTNKVSESLINTIQYIAEQDDTDQYSPIDGLMEDLLCGYSECSESIYSLLSAPNGKPNILPKTYMQSLLVMDIQKWLNEAEKLGETNVYMSHKLLNYLAKNDIKRFHIEAKRLFNIFPRELVDTVSSYVDATIDKEFAKHIWKYYTRHSNNIDHYSHLAPLLNQSEKYAFIDSFRSDYDKIFYIRLLEFEGLYSQIVDFIRNTRIEVYSIEKLMSGIIKRFPLDCFDIAEPIIRKYLDQNINRDAYATAASALAFLKTDERNIPNVTALAQELLALYPRRSAMRSEFNNHKLNN